MSGDADPGLVGDLKKPPNGKTMKSFVVVLKEGTGHGSRECS